MTKEEIDHWLHVLTVKKKECEISSREIELQVSHDFLRRAFVDRQKALDEVSKQLKWLQEDMEVVNDQLKSLRAASDSGGTDKCDEHLTGDSQKDDQVPEGVDSNLQASSLRGKKRPYQELLSSDLAIGSPKSASAKDEGRSRMAQVGKMSALRKKCVQKIEQHFNDIQDVYFDWRLGARTPADTVALTEQLSTTLSRFSRYTRLRTLANLTYHDSFFTSTSSGGSSSMSIVSSVEFDKDDEYFAFAGVAKKIKIYEYAAVVEDYRDMGYLLGGRRNGNGFITRGTTPMSLTLGSIGSPGTSTPGRSISRNASRNSVQTPPRFVSENDEEADEENDNDDHEGDGGESVADEVVVDGNDEVDMGGEEHEEVDGDAESELARESSDDVDQEPMIDSSPVDTLIKFPVRSIACRSKISCLSYNPYIKGYLASSDYEGIISLWDVNTSTAIHHFDEHERRTWTVDFCLADPQRMASAGDDTKVKVWSTTQRQSVVNIDTRANVCSVKFNPSNSFHLAFGSADHQVHYYDLRKPSEALHVFKGHKKAVSFVKFTSPYELVSASTDSTLRLWSLPASCSTGVPPRPSFAGNTPSSVDASKSANGASTSSDCIRTFSGHFNERNFVGLSVNSDGEFISTGSENNTAYVYYRQIRRPVLEQKFGNGIDTLKGSELKDEDPTTFVSSVMWRRRSPTELVCANSLGRVKVMEMV
ncbi:WD40-repeat-containing domain protein [Cladochytrium replicatum]|nr:WD40-repeat-containing domain protein [Cladochytrium replicatum]